MQQVATKRGTMKRTKTTNKLTEAERREITEQVKQWAQARGKPSTKAELKMRWQQIVFTKIKSDAERRRTKSERHAQHGTHSDMTR